ncbi:hypothetical protein BDQ17DRAFT_154879 [Cyathus striatus]|nr:hypothetical protein BDQ17DRAFT_154879 [Cyathus striatus]
MLSSCRGLVEGQRSTQIVSSHILSLFLAQASVRGQSYESSADVQYDMLCRAERSVRNYLTKLAERTVEQWESPMNDTTILLEGKILNIQIYSSLLSLLSHSDNVFRFHGIQIMTDSPIRSIFQNDSTDDMFNHVKSNIYERLITLMISDQDKSVSGSALKFMLQLLERRDQSLKLKIESITAQQVQTGLNILNKASEKLSKFFD